MVQNLLLKMSSSVENLDWLLKYSIYILCVLCTTFYRYSYSMESSYGNRNIIGKRFWVLCTLYKHMTTTSIWVDTTNVALCFCMFIANKYCVLIFSLQGRRCWKWNAFSVIVEMLGIYIAFLHGLCWYILPFFSTVSLSYAYLAEYKHALCSDLSGETDFDFVSCIYMYGTREAFVWIMFWGKWHFKFSLRKSFPEKDFLKIFFCSQFCNCVALLNLLNILKVCDIDNLFEFNVFFVVNILGR